MTDPALARSLRHGGSRTSALVMLALHRIKIAAEVTMAARNPTVLAIHRTNVTMLTSLAPAFWQTISIQVNGVFQADAKADG